MAEYGYSAIQSVSPGENAIMNTIIRCPNGLVLHREQSGIITLRGPFRRPCGFARYQVMANCNIALADGATVGPISVALTIGGETIPTSRAIVTPAAVGDYFNVSCPAIIDVPFDCCYDIGLKNVSVSATPGTTPAPTIDMQNLNLTVTRIA